MYTGDTGYGLFLLHCEGHHISRTSAIGMVSMAILILMGKIFTYPNLIGHCHGYAYYHVSFAE